MFGRKAKAAVMQREVSGAGSRAAEVVGEAAERAAAAAREAQRVATPVLRSAAHTSADALSHAAERAAGVLADTADRLGPTGEVTLAARHKLADASQAISQSVRPKRRHRMRRLMAFGLLVGGIVALVKSPLRSKIADRLFGAPPDFDDDTPESITLPATPLPSTTEQEPPTDQTASGDGSSTEVSGGIASASGREENAQG